MEEILLSPRGGVNEQGDTYLAGHNIFHFFSHPAKKYEARKNEGTTKRGVDTIDMPLLYARQLSSIDTIDIFRP
jgi:hypothetical protein